MENAFIGVSWQFSNFSKFSYISEKFRKVVGKVVVVGLTSLVWKLFRLLFVAKFFIFFDRDSFILVDNSDFLI